MCEKTKNKEKEVAIDPFKKEVVVENVRVPS